MELVLTEREPLIIFNGGCAYRVSGKWDAQKDQMDIVANLLIQLSPQTGTFFSHKNLFGFGSTSFN